MFDFEKDVLVRSKDIAVLLEISANACGPCVWMEKTLIEVVEKMKGKVELISQPVSLFPHCETLLNLTTVPTTILFIDGKEMGRLKGALPVMVVDKVAVAVLPALSVIS